MNIEQFHAIAKELLHYYKDTNIDVELRSLRDSLANQESQPNQPQFQQNVSTQIVKLQKILSNTIVESFNPVWNDILDNLGCRDYLGSRLLEKILKIFRENTITPSVAKKEIEILYTYINGDRENIEKIVGCFTHFNIGFDELSEDEAELGIRIPRSFVSNNLQDFSKELHLISKEFKVFNEIVTGSRTELKLKSISSSEFNIFIEYLPEVAMFATLVIEKSINIYKGYIDIRKHHEGLKNQGLPENTLKEISDYLDNEIKSKASQAAEELINQYKVESKRANELETELKNLICNLAYRIDNGFNFSARCGEPNASEDEEDPNNKKILFFEQIQKSNKTLEYLKLDGEPILSLPDIQVITKSTDKDANQSIAKKDTKKDK